MPENLELLEKVKQVVEENSPDSGSLNYDDPLLQTGVIDSLTILKVFSGLQLATGADIDITDITEENFSNLRSIAALISSRQ